LNSRPKTRAIFQQAQEILVGGVNSPVRAFKAVGGDPLVVERAAGARLFDVDGNEYIDYVCSWGAMILGHAHPAVTSAIQDQASRGTSYGMTTELEVELARAIRRAMPSLEMIRFVSSGTEATMSAVRLARAATGRDFILKFDGGYHGHADSFLSQAGSGLATLGIASSPGVPTSFAALTLNAPFNDVAAVEQLFDAHREQIAAVIVEPVAANMGVVPPKDGFLRGLREITRKHNALLIFDEVISGFRLAHGGAQAVYGIQPDLTTLGKIIGGGLPAAAFGGRAELQFGKSTEKLMTRVAPLGPVYQAGTLSGNPLAMRAGIETLKQLDAPGFYEQLNRKTEKLVAGIRAAIAKSGVSARVSAAGSLLTLFFTGDAVGNYADAKRSDTKMFGEFFLRMLERGIFLPPSQFEALFVSAAHSDSDIDRTIVACEESLQALAASAVGG
jgi:glutamate-1-semialdehyde 2,1-aminomutase